MRRRRHRTSLASERGFAGGAVFANAAALCLGEGALE